MENAKHHFVADKMKYIYHSIQNTFASLEYYATLDLFSHNDMNVATSTLKTLYDTTHQLSEKNVDDHFDEVVEGLQSILNCLAGIFYIVGTFSFSDLAYVLLGPHYGSLKDDVLLQSKMNIIKSNVFPIQYKCKTVTIDNTIITENTNDVFLAPHLACFEPSIHYTSLYFTAYGLRVVLRDEEQKKAFVVQGFVRNVPIQCLMHEAFVSTRYTEIRALFEDESPLIDRWLATLTIKDILVCEDADVLKKHKDWMADVEYVKKTHIDIILKKFQDMDYVNKRKFLIHLLLFNDDTQIKYIAYMLYDVLGSNTKPHDSVDNTIQKLIYNSFPWLIKQYFKESMTHTLQYTVDALDSTNSGISLEQRILLLRVSDAVKEKSIRKLKDAKGKFDENGTKTKQYLEALVKIPFGNYRREPVLDKVQGINVLFTNWVQEYGFDKIEDGFHISVKPQYTMHEIQDSIRSIKAKMRENRMAELSRKKTSDILALYKTTTDKKRKVPKKKDDMIRAILDQDGVKTPADKGLESIQNDILVLQGETEDMMHHLDESVYGHKEAKTEIMKIISQWMTGEQTGYCFGFEGPPGVGKTSLAKRGLAQCLKDENGIARPFSFIALGGSCNGSTLDGHSYTYMNSKWGGIVDILMDSRCMNPIIYVDELDKVSKTEQGKEIVGILMHLIDSTQNTEFQDKYFSGIPIDVSKVLFVFSYNDPDQIDPILLDRIHRIRFDHLSWKDKVVITRQFIIPDLDQKMGFHNTIVLSDDVLEHIIVEYTAESGVRHLKEILFDLYGEINLGFLQCSITETPPIHVKCEDLGVHYLKKYRKALYKKIHDAPEVGIVNGMWANALGGGGIIPIEVVYFPCTAFLDLRLTGLQGDVMKESMNVANRWRGHF